MGEVVGRAGTERLNPDVPPGFQGESISVRRERPAGDKATGIHFTGREIERSLGKGDGDGMPLAGSQVQHADVSRIVKDDLALPALAGSYGGAGNIIVRNLRDL